VLAEEVTRHDSAEAAIQAYHDGRFERCRYIVESLLAICNGQIGKGPQVDNHKATAEMFARLAELI
jgi:hypothetical protein